MTKTKEKFDLYDLISLAKNSKRSLVERIEDIVFATKYYTKKMDYNEAQKFVEKYR